MGGGEMPAALAVCFDAIADGKPLSILPGVALGLPCSGKPMFDQPADELRIGNA